MIDPAKCPLCGQPNNCQLCTDKSYKGPCWCASVTVSKVLLAKIHDDSKNAACLCKNCIESATRELHRQQPIFD